MKKYFLPSPIKELRVRYWYEGVRRQLGEASAFGLEKRFDRKLSDQDDSKLGSTKKWPRYKNGRRVPQSKLVASVEVEVPGSSKELGSVLWPVLLADEISLRKAPRYINQLEPDLRRAIANWRRAEATGTRNLLWYSQGRTLVGAGSLDALAALVLIWEIYRHQAHDDGMRTAAELIYRCMLVVGDTFKARGLLAEFFGVLNAKVFSRTTWENGRCILDAEMFAQGVDRLNHTVTTVRDEGKLQSQKAIDRVKKSLIYGKKGYDCLFGLGIPIVPDWRVGPPTRGQQQDGMLKLLQWFWGWTHLTNQTIGKFPFDDLWRDLEADIEAESGFW
ncbi:hypothetical protein VI26_02145 [Chromobacterium sp. LK1]|uniref:hypothetical protein n=1 Tax=Chromobacterium sp. LK1 TaxID=1628193 RepID=UPI0006539564|nr:hypothetical protein [Chromobacterium sp. LK1]KMN37750.1 hypothetical protein VI26_02145 [Chromobacterium sp. LK1]